MTNEEIIFVNRILTKVEELDREASSLKTHCIELENYIQYMLKNFKKE